MKEIAGFLPVSSVEVSALLVQGNHDAGSGQPITQCNDIYTNSAGAIRPGIPNKPGPSLAAGHYLPLFTTQTLHYGSGGHSWAG
jgi:hypothetical protein